MLIALGSIHASTIDFKDNFVFGIVEVGFGTPSKAYSLILDTGSENTPVGIRTKYQSTGDSKLTGNDISVEFSKISSFKGPIGLSVGYIPDSKEEIPTQNQVIGGDPTVCYLAVGDLGNPSGTGMDFIIGYYTLKHYNVVLDTGDNKLGSLKGDDDMWRYNSCFLE
ncbi:hypothetical protein BGX27_006540 [Mortierella sp. AM989]|nr:hypothetical protein BGX27_006540 [Mortierella sp. AM989]